MVKTNRHIVLAIVATACMAFSATSCSGVKSKKLEQLAAYAERTVGQNGHSDDMEASSENNETYAGGLEIPSKSTDIPEQILRRVGYTASYNRSTLIPNWVAWHLTAAHTTGPFKRGGIKFTADTDVPSPRAEDDDYRGSGYDRGHLCPSGDNKWSEEAQRQSFLFTNICPQDGGLNRGDWNELEMNCRDWAEQYGDLYIVAGPILYKGKHKKIGRNHVTVPEAFFKVVLRTKGTPKAIGFIYKNTSGNRPLDSYLNTVDEVERITGFDFFSSLPDDVENKVESEADTGDWN